MPDLKNLSSFFVNVFHTVFAVPRKKAQKKHGKKTKKRKSGIFTGNRFFVLRPRYILQAFRLLFYRRIRLCEQLGYTPDLFS